MSHEVSEQRKRKTRSWEMFEFGSFRCTEATEGDGNIVTGALHLYYRLLCPGESVENEVKKKIIELRSSSRQSWKKSFFFMTQEATCSKSRKRHDSKRRMEVLPHPIRRLDTSAADPHLFSSLRCHPLTNISNKSRIYNITFHDESFPQNLHSSPDKRQKVMRMIV